MYLIGENSINFPWYIPKDFPNRALEGENKEKFLTYLKRKQILLDWTESEKNVFYLMNIFFPPLASWLHNYIRNIHFKALEDSLYECFDKDFWDDRAQKTLRVSATCHQGYIDFLDKSKSKLDFNGNKLPINLMLSGCGTFNSPYYLNFENDPYAKALVYLNEDKMKKDLPLFFNNLNGLLSKLSFFKLGVQTMKDLSDVIAWIEVGNKTLFNPQNVKATFFLFENSY